MSSYVSSIAFSLISFPLLALVCTIPYMIYQYRRFGSIPFWKSFAVFAFIFYITTAYYLVILPLPEDRSAVVAYASTPQLTPFNFLKQIEVESSFALSEPSTWIAMVFCPGFYEVIFNLLLTVPLGIFLRYFFNRKWWQVLLIGFATTLFFEISQLTGLFGIYAHPYRLFDVDDLIVNTAGAMVGFWLTAPLCRHLPNIDELNEYALENSGHFTSFTRRLLAFAIDMVPVACACLLSVVFRPHDADVSSALLGAFVLWTGVFYMLIPALTRGATIGDALLKLRIVRPDASPVARWQPALRYALLFWCFFAVPLLFLDALPAKPVDGSPLSWPLLAALLLIVYAVWLITIVVRAVRSAQRHPFVMLNGMISRTRVMSVEQAAYLQKSAHRKKSLHENERFDMPQGEQAIHSDGKG